jgi:hypothetical protein
VSPLPKSADFATAKLEHIWETPAPDGLLVRVLFGWLLRQLELNEESLPPTGVTGSRLTTETAY